MKARFAFGLVVAVGLTACGASPPAAEVDSTEENASPSQGQPTRLYVLDCGQLTLGNASQLSLFSLSENEVSTMTAAVPCFLVEHERGTLMWDLGLPDGLHPDGMIAPEGDPLAGSELVVDKTMVSQLAELGYEPRDIDYFAMSHMHFDHAGNANLFQDVTWLARRAERDYVFADPPPEGVGWIHEFYEELRDVDPHFIEGHHDVFGDGAVVIRAASGHTPGHQVLFVDLAETGAVVLSGDLYHFPQSRELRRVPTFNYDETDTLASMVAVEAFLEESGAELWIEHDVIHNATLKKSPEYYE